MMKKNIFYSCTVLLILSSVTISAQNLKLIKGRVTNYGEPLKNASIIVEGTDRGAFSNDLGTYEVKAKKGEIIVCTHVGMDTIKIKVQDVTRFLNIEMNSTIEQLDEVVVKSSIKRSEQQKRLEYEENKEIIRGAFSTIDKNKAGGSVFIFDNENRTANYQCILDLLRGKFPSAQVSGNCQTGGAVIIRGLSSINLSNNAIFDIDGLISEEAPIWIPVQNMRRVAVLSSMSMTGAYGTQGRNGVVVINTFTGNPIMKVEERLTAYQNTELYQNDALSKDRLLKNTSSSLQDLHNAPNIDSFNKIIDSLKNTIQSSYFYVDVLSLYIEKWKNYDSAKTILDENYKNWKTDPVLLKSVAYILDEHGMYDKAHNIYKDVFVLRPDYLQSYMDLIDSFQDIGKPLEAKKIMIRMLDLINRGLFKSTNNDFNQIKLNEVIALNQRLVGNKIQTEVEESLFNFSPGDTRIKLEWNNNEAEFLVQFVNPKKQITYWEHTMLAQSSLVNAEKEGGYNVKDFFADDFLKGTWQVNVIYLGNKALTPTYLKVSVYQNFGTEKQTKTVSTHKLSAKKVNKKLISFSI